MSVTLMAPEVMLAYSFKCPKLSTIILHQTNIRPLVTNFKRLSSSLATFHLSDHSLNNHTTMLVTEQTA